ncbi:MAG: outer membrane lipid asymmetry maintenance protein MlaD [Halothiobacillaceae bacterium]|nr:MAG: outer membrane lipid asymmetry maintenance protein MlaD [Halothiobacillaceae bacterium]
MQENSMRDVWVGLFVALGLVALGFLALRVSNLASLSNDAGYGVTAQFDNIGGLKVRAPIKLAGVVVGRVESIAVDPQTFRAAVGLRIENRYPILPTDTSAAIYTSGLLGEQYIGLAPGAEEAVLKDGDRISLTQSSIVLENLIGQFLYNKAAEGEKQ